MGTLRSNDATATRTNVKKIREKIGLISKTTTLHVYHTFLYISLPFLHDYDVKMPISRFMENVNKRLSELEYGPLEFNFRRARLHLTK